MQYTRESIAGRYFDGKEVLVGAWDIDPEHNLIVVGCAMAVKVIQIDAAGVLQSLRTFYSYTTDFSYRVTNVRIVSDCAVLVTGSNKEVTLLDLNIGVFREGTSAQQTETSDAFVGESVLAGV